MSNNSAHRWTPDVPMILPEINADHAEVIKEQRKRLGVQRGFIAVKPNCSIQSYTPVLTAWKDYQPYEVIVTTYQAISGAGKNFETRPEMTGNMIPFIPGEEEKSEQEPLRIWGSVRVPILYGHTAAVFLNFRNKPTREQLIEKLWKYLIVKERAAAPADDKSIGAAALLKSIFIF